MSSNQQIPPLVQEQLAKLQQTQQNFQSILMQKQQLESEKLETEKALEELKKTSDDESVFKHAGTIMIKSNKKDLIEELEEQLELAYKDLIAFGKLFLPDDFMRSETPPFHYEMADAIDDLSVKQLGIVLPRGHGKTVLTKASIIKDFVFCPKDDMHFYAWVAATQKLSVGNMDYIKHHLEFNDRILYYFGNLKGRKWTEEDIELKNGCKLISKSNVGVFEKK